MLGSRESARRPRNALRVGEPLELGGGELPGGFGSRLGRHRDPHRLARVRVVPDERVGRRDDGEDPEEEGADEGEGKASGHGG